MEMHSVDSTESQEKKSSHKMLPPGGDELRASDFHALHASLS